MRTTLLLNKGCIAPNKGSEPTAHSVRALVLASSVACGLRLKPGVRAAEQTNSFEAEHDMTMFAANIDTSEAVKTTMRQVISSIPLFFMVLIMMCLSSENLRAQENEDLNLAAFIEENRLMWANSGWEGKLRSKKVITAQDLLSIVEEHELWLKTNEASGSKADLSGAKLSGAYLSHRNLAWALLENVDMTGSNLSGAFLMRADVSNSKLAKVDFMYANLSGADLAGSILINTDLSESDLSGANLRNSRLMHSNLRNANLQDAELDGADLFGALGLVGLRRQFKDSGAISLAKKITYEIKRSDRITSWDLGFLGKLDSMFKLIMFELPCKYGYAPGRALILLLLLIVPFAVVYVYVISVDTNAAILETYKVADVEKRVRIHHKGKRAWAIGFYYSLLSAFEIGWKEFTISNWITRLQTREYLLVSSGWVRSLSGIQSLISVYLFALWALTYFGSPFE